MAVQRADCDLCRKPERLDEMIGLRWELVISVFGSGRFARRVDPVGAESRICLECLRSIGLIAREVEAEDGEDS